MEQSNAQALVKSFCDRIKVPLEQEFPSKRRPPYATLLASQGSISSSLSAVVVLVEEGVKNALAG